VTAAPADRPALTAGRADEATSYCPTEPVDLGRTLQRLAHGVTDPTFRRTSDGVTWLTSSMPTGAATLRLVQVGPARIDVAGWGPGVGQALAGVPSLLGSRDDPRSFDPGRDDLARALRSNPGLRIPRTGRVLAALVPAVLEQRVVSRTATAAWRWLLDHHGGPAPGPAPSGMRMVPDAEAWLRVPSWDFHRAGVDPGRARTIRSCARVARRLEETTAMSPLEASRRLQAVPGVGPWTAAEVAQRALGDSDAVSVGDFHLAAAVGWALTGRRVDDSGMLALLEPWRGHRYRVIRLLELSGLARAPRRGPRTTITDHRGS